MKVHLKVYELEWSISFINWYIIYVDDAFVTWQSHAHINLYRKMSTVYLLFSLLVNEIPVIFYAYTVKLLFFSLPWSMIRKRKDFLSINKSQKHWKESQLKNEMEYVNTFRANPKSSSDCITESHWFRWPREEPFFFLLVIHFHLWFWFHST